MSKLPSPQQIAESLDVKIQRHQLNSTDMEEFVGYVQEQKKTNPDVKVSLKDYVQEKFYAGVENIVVVPDFSGATIGKNVIKYDVNDLREAYDLDEKAGMTEPEQENEPGFLANMKAYIDSQRDQNLDLSSVDFTGCRIDGARFVSCNLTGVDARDADFKGVVLHDCITKEMDFRGADISGLKFTDIDFAHAYIPLKPISESALLTYRNDGLYVGMKFSTSESMLHRYSDENERIEKHAEKLFNERLEEQIKGKKELLSKSEQRIEEAYSKTSYYENLWSGGENYDRYISVKNQEAPKIAKLNQEISELSNKEFDNIAEKDKINYIAHPSVIESLLIVSDSVQNNYDPAYKRGSSGDKNQEKTQYLRLTRQDAENYLKACESNPKLSINEFAKGLMESKGIKEVPGAKIVADFSVYIDKSQENYEYAGVTTDLSGLDFSNRDLRGACFVGANLQDCKFNDAKLDNATLEGADASRSDFTGVSAKDTNLQAIKIQSAIIENADFSRAYMPHARVHDLERDEISEEIQTPGKLHIAKSKFDFANLSNANLDGAKIENSTFDYADLSGVSLANADIQRCKMRHANLERAILNNCQMIETDLSGSILREAEAKRATFKETVLEQADLRSVNLSESEIGELCKLSGANLEKAIMQKVKADRVNFVGVNMKEANLQYAQLKGAIVKDVDLSFSNLEGAIADGIKASGVDMTGADLTEISARGAEFKGAQLESIKAHRADLSEAVLESANLRGARMHEAILEKVNLKKADLRNAELERANLEKASVDNAKVNDGTDMNHAKAEGISGEFEHEAEDGTKTKMKPEVKIEQDNQAHASKNRSALGKFTAKVAGVIGNGVKKVGEFIKQPLSTKWGKVIGAAIGVAVAAVIITSAVLTAGLSIPVMAAVAGGTVLACGAVGAVAGHFAAKHSGLSTLVGAGVGFGVLGPIGAAIGAAGVGAVNAVTKQLFGTTIDRAVGGTFEKAGEIGQRHAENVEKQKEREVAQQKSNELYNPPIKETSKDQKIDRTQEAINREVAQSRSKDIDISRGENDLSVKQKTVDSKEKTLTSELEIKAKKVGQTMEGKISSGKDKKGPVIKPKTPTKENVMQK